MATKKTTAKKPPVAPPTDPGEKLKEALRQAALTECLGLIGSLIQRLADDVDARHSSSASAPQQQEEGVVFSHNLGHDPKKSVLENAYDVYLFIYATTDTSIEGPRRVYFYPSSENLIAQARAVMQRCCEADPYTFAEFCAAVARMLVKPAAAPKGKV